MKTENKLNIINCEYIVVNNDCQLKKAEKYFGNSKVHYLKYPFSIGKEKGFVFYSQKIDLIDYLDEKNNEKYTYNRITI